VVANKPAGDGDDEELFAADERLDGEAVLDRLDDVPHALDEERPADIPVRAIGLESFDLIERGLRVVRKTIGVDFIRHSPFGEPGARSEDAGRTMPATGHERSRSEVRGPHP
jgi:hypothetical protein